MGTWIRGAVIGLLVVALAVVAVAPPPLRTAVALMLILLLAIGVPVAVNRWGRRREDEVDDYHERDLRDPPAIGGGPWPGGGGGSGYG